MTSKERLMTALKGEVPDRVPCSPSVTRYARYHYGCTCPRHMVKAGEELGFDPIAYYGTYLTQSVSNNYVYSPGGGYAFNANGLYGDLPDVEVELRVENKEDQVWYYRKFHTPKGSLADVIQWARPNMKYGDGPNPHRVEPLVKRRSDLEALEYLYPEPRKDIIADIPILLEDIGDRAVVVAYDTTSFGCWGMEVLGPENMLVSSLTDPDLLVGVCRLSNDTHLKNLRAMLEQGLEVVYDSWFQCGPSVGWSPETYQNVFLPLIREVVDLAHEFGALYLYQDDGKMRDIIPHLVAAGVDCISGLQPPAVGDVILKEVKEKYGDQVALYGGLDSCYTFDMGSPDDVRAAVRQAISDAGDGGGYIIGTGEAVDPTQTSSEHLRAAAETARKFGVYR